VTARFFDAPVNANEKTITYGVFADKIDTTRPFVFYIANQSSRGFVEISFSETATVTVLGEKQSKQVSITGERPAFLHALGPPTPLP
jgi:hypothetical protein